MSSPQIVLISGCSSGMGLATAVFLAKDAQKRFKVYATMRNLAKKGQLEEEGKEYLGDTLVIKQMDVCSDESVEKAVKEVLDTEERIDVLFNNAGVSLSTILDCVPMEMAKEVFDINFFGTLRLIQAVLPSMKARQSGHIINNSSVFGIIGTPFFEIYSASKFAVEGLTESLVPILKQFNIRCTLLEPGPVSSAIGDNNTERTKGVDLKTVDQKTQDLWVRMLGRIGPTFEGNLLTSQEIAEVVQGIILSDEGQFRYLPNKAMLDEEITARFADATGFKSVNLITKKFCDEK
ncbi:retinol dehydrogenase 8-like [Stylophora pistillata]|uniref:Retinol dehydrogenase 8 n=1 Tax=Stylophora pistillata TaxID=50429 RepID=A0A2B4SHK9_STYPI|nr:retinol dehydrogenase 8-like [Stylophora pistillata]PFX30154.1 Retinol dehydrogenase 8 [Stylophora pistillata]